MSPQICINFLHPPQKKYIPKAFNSKLIHNNHNWMTNEMSYNSQIHMYMNECSYHSNSNNNGSTSTDTTVAGITIIIGVDGSGSSKKVRRKIFIWLSVKHEEDYYKFLIKEQISSPPLPSQCSLCLMSTHSILSMFEVYDTQSDTFQVNFQSQASSLCWALFLK